MKSIISCIRTMATVSKSNKPVLYGYAKSSCSWRVRAAFAYKNIEFDQVTFDPYTSTAEEEAKYKKRNPLRQVPLLEIDGHALTQSVAMLEYIEETRPQHPLMPKDPLQRARVRQVVEVINSGTQPLQNPPIAQRACQDPAKQKEWQVYWMEKGLEAVEKLLQEYSGKYCVGDQLTFADLTLVPQMFSSRRFGANLKKFPTCLKMFEMLLEQEAFRKTHPHNQPDTPDEERGIGPI